MTRTTRSSRRLTALAAVVLLVGVAGEVVQLVLVARTPVVALFPWGIAVLLLPISTLAIGGLLVRRRPELTEGWLLLIVGALIATESAVGAVGASLLPAAPGSVRFGVAQWMLWYGGADQWGWVPALGLMFTQVLLRFPDGALPSPRWRGFSWFTIVAIAALSVVQGTLVPTVAHGVPNPTYVAWPGGQELVSSIGAFVFAPALLGSVASLIVRYRRSDAVARAQLRWIFWAAALIVGFLILSWFGDPSTPGIWGVIDLVVSSAVALGYSLLPVAIFVAITRYGLYSIDRIISRTAAYAVVTLAIVAVYAGIVLVTGLLLPGLTSVGVAAATLAAAALFLPLLRVVRRVVDRRFDRARYDAQRVVDRFGERIRTASDPSGAGGDLVAAVQVALQPSAIGIWRKDGDA